MEHLDTALLLIEAGMHGDVIQMDARLPLKCRPLQLALWRLRGSRRADDDDAGQLVGGSACCKRFWNAEHLWMPQKMPRTREVCLSLHRAVGLAVRFVLEWVALHLLPLPPQQQGATAPGNALIALQRDRMHQHAIICCLAAAAHLGDAATDLYPLFRQADSWLLRLLSRCCSSACYHQTQLHFPIFFGKKSCLAATVNPGTSLAIYTQALQAVVREVLLIALKGKTFSRSLSAASVALGLLQAAAAPA